MRNKINKINRILVFVVAIVATAESASAVDSVPPASITNLGNVSYAQNYINWTWNDPIDSDFSKVMIYINDKFKTNVTKGKQYYNYTGLQHSTIYRIGTHTVDSSGNINYTWVNSSAFTAPDIISPNSITDLMDVSHSQNYINWTWNDPTNPDFSKVSIYINGVFITNVSKGIKYYRAIGLNPDTEYEIGTHTIDSSGNINYTWVNDSETTDSISGNYVRFVTIGDTHITTTIGDNAYQNFTRAINYINNMTDVDFIVEMGDIVDNANNASFDIAKSIISKSNKPYYVVEGNHDIGTIPGANFVNHFGPTTRIDNFNGYQLLFVGIKKNGTTVNGTLIAYDWVFNYSNIDKNKPTIIFSHGPVQPKPGKSCSNWDSSSSAQIYFSYACSMKAETDKFTNLFGFYAGHVHTGTNQTINNTLYVTEDNLGGNGAASPYIGYTVIQNGATSYSLIRY